MPYNAYSELMKALANEDLHMADQLWASHERALAAGDGGAIQDRLDQLSHPNIIGSAKGSVASLKWLASHGVDLDNDLNGASPLHASLNLNQHEQVRNLILAGASLEKRFPNGQTIMNMLMMSPDAENHMKMLDQEGISLAGALNQPGPGGATPLMAAASMENWPAVEWLLSKGADPLPATYETEETLFILMARLAAPMEMIDALLDRFPEIDIDRPMRSGTTALSAAATQMRRDLIMSLIRRGASMDVQVTDTYSDGSHVFQVLAKMDRDPGMPLLNAAIDSIPDPTVRDAFGRNILFYLLQSPFGSLISQEGLQSYVAQVMSVAGVDPSGEKDEQERDLDAGRAVGKAKDKASSEKARDATIKMASRMAVAQDGQYSEALPDLLDVMRKLVSLGLPTDEVLSPDGSTVYDLAFSVAGRFPKTSARLVKELHGMGFSMEPKIPESMASHAEISAAGKVRASRPFLVEAFSSPVGVEFIESLIDCGLPLDRPVPKKDGGPDGPLPLNLLSTSVSGGVQKTISRLEGEMSLARPLSVARRILDGKLSDDEAAKAQEQVDLARDRKDALTDLLRQQRASLADRILSGRSEGLNMNAVDHRGVSPLMEAARNSNMHLADVLVSHGASPFVPAGDAPDLFSSLLASGNLSGLHGLASRCPPKSPDERRQFEQILLNAIELGGTSLPGAVAGLRTSPYLPLWLNARDETGATPLILAARYGETQIVCDLVDLDADVDLADQHGYTALHHAVGASSVDAIGFLFKDASDLPVDASNRTAMQVAEMLGLSEHMVPRSEEERSPLYGLDEKGVEQRERFLAKSQFDVAAGIASWPSNVPGIASLPDLDLDFIDGIVERGEAERIRQAEEKKAQKAAEKLAEGGAVSAVPVNAAPVSPTGSMKAF